MGATHHTQSETYNPWTIVNVVFGHLADQGLHPVLGESGDPGEPARGLLRALGIEPRAEGNAETSRRVHERLAEIRWAVFESHRSGGEDPPPVSRSET